MVKGILKTSDTPNCQQGKEKQLLLHTTHTITN